MLKSVKKSQTNDISAYSSFDHSSSITSKSKISRRFIGFSSVRKGNIFRSYAPKFYPWRITPSTEEWIGDSLCALTSRWRSQFQIFTEVTNSFKYYQILPVKIPYIDKNSKRHIYQPLALLTYWDDDLSPRNRKSLLVDIRSDTEIKENAKTLIPAFYAAHRFAQRRKLQFKLFRDRFFLSNYFANLSFVRQFCLSNVDTGNRVLVKEVLKSLSVIEFSELIDILCGMEFTNKRGQLIRDVWTLVQEGEIGVDWNRPFNRKTLLWL